MLLGDDYSTETIGDLFDQVEIVEFLSKIAMQDHLSWGTKAQAWHLKKDTWEMT